MIITPSDESCSYRSHRDIFNSPSRSIYFLLYLARGVMNSSFWKMGIAKNRRLLLLLFVPGSSRASVRSTATDDREDLTFLSLCPPSSPRLLSVYLLLQSIYPRWHPAVYPWNLIHFIFPKLFVLGHRGCFCTALSRDHLSVKQSITLTFYHQSGAEAPGGGALWLFIYEQQCFGCLLCFCYNVFPCVLSLCFILRSHQARLNPSLQDVSGPPGRVEAG